MSTNGALNQRILLIDSNVFFARRLTEALKAQGFRVGIAGNQPEAAETALAEAGVPADFIASSAGWGVEKPDPAFFAKVADVAGAPPSAIAYVGDRLDNDVRPARRAGMLAVFLRRGPWGVLAANAVTDADADLKLDALDGLAEKLAAWR